MHPIHVAARRAALWAFGLSMLVPASGQAQASQRQTVVHTVVGRLDEHVVTGPEPIGSRRLYVLLPPEFDPSQRYPTVYAQDGQDLFDAATAAGGEEWGLDELIDAKPPGIPPLILVGIEAAPHAILDMAPPGSTEGARADLYLRFLAELVKPLVDRTYPTRSGRQSAFVLGRGAGALFSIYAAWTRSDVFGGAIAIELPDVDQASLAWVQEKPPSRPKLWIEQSAGNVAMRPSATTLLESLRTGAQVEYSMGGAETSTLVLVGAGLRALFSP